MNKEQKSLNIKIMLKKKGITQRELAKLLDISPQSLSNRLNGDSLLDADFILKLKPILGDEVMELLNTTPAVHDENTRPRIPYDVVAGGLTQALDGVTEYQCEQVPVISVFPRYDFTMRVTGDSMMPYLHPGDEVACLRINEATFLQWGRIHVLDTSQGVVVKRIYETAKGIRCVSYNEAYSDFVIPKTEIYSFNLVVGVIRL